MAIYRGPGGSGDAVNDSSSETRLAVEARDAAIAAQAAAEAAKVAAQTAKTNAETAETNAETAATNASTSATSASSAASAAHTYATNAATSETNAASSASSASTSATNAASSASSASTSASSASTSATNAASSASSASTSATNAASSASSASTSASTATTKASEASTSATNAASSATSAAGSATTATTQAGIATTKASEASTSATNAANSASSAATSATNAASSASSASTSASNASTSASNASAAQIAAESARDATLAAYDSFDDRYLGVKIADPVLDNDGNALQPGELYFNSVDGVMKVYTGTIWTAAYVSGAGVLLQTNNLSDLASASTARTNLGLGTAATTAATDYATAAQGAKADTALQPATIGVSVQGYDADLQAIGALSGTSGLLKKTAANTWSLDTNTYLTSAVTSVTGTSPISSSGGNTPAISISQANTTTNGYLSSTDWNTFNGKQSALVSGTNIKTVGGVSLLGSGDVGTLGVGYGGTGQTSFTAGQIHFGSFSTSVNLFWDNTNSKFLVGTTTSPSGGALNIASVNSSGGGIQFGFPLNGGGAILGLTGGGQGFYTYTGAQGSESYSERMRIDSSGNVGIGTSSPGVKLDVVGQGRILYNTGSTNTGDQSVTTIGAVTTGAYASSYGAGLQFQITNSGGGYSGGRIVSRLGADNFTANLVFQARNYGYTDSMTLDSSGNLGIGTSSPTNKLSVIGADGSVIARVAGASYAVTFNSDAGSGARIEATDPTGVGSYQPLITNGSLQVFRTGNTERMRIDSSGNVGIGTSSPSSKLQLVGDMRINSVATATTGIPIYAKQVNNDQRGIWTESATTDSNGRFYCDNSVVGIAASYSVTGSYLPIAFLTSATERMRIGSDGGVMVGTTTSPGAGKIADVSGNVRSIPQNSQTAAYVLVAGDNGKHISITTGGVTVNASVFSVGDVVTIFNNSGSNQTITQGTSVTMRQAGTANTGNRTLAQYGVATILCVASNTFVISGAGLT